MSERQKVFLLNFLSTILLLVAFGAAFGTGYLVRDRFGPVNSELPVLNQAYELLQQNGYNPIPTAPKLEYGMIQGMVQAYGDPYTHFSEPIQHQLSSQTLEGKFGGVGVTLHRDADNTVFLVPIPDGPAAQAGVKEGDRLVQVDDLIVEVNTTNEQIISKARGEVGTKVTIGITRPPDNTRLDFTITRIEIALPSVTSYIEPSEPRLGIVKVNVIAATTADEILKAFTDLQSRGATHFALDLRNNGGGYLESGVDIARLFLKTGSVIQQQYKGKDIKTYAVEKPGPLADVPLLVLVNQNTASAAEIISGAIQAQKRAELIGTHTYGKDTIQLVFELQDKSSLSVTAAHWWVPGIPKFGGIGLQPDIPMETADPIPDQPDPAIQAALKAFFTP